MTLSPGRDPATCAYPPHPVLPGVGDDLGELPEYAADSAAARFGAWLRHAPAERVPLLAALALWPAAVVLHALHVPGWLPVAGTVAAAGLAYGMGERHAAAADEEHPRMRGAELAAAAAAAGVWLSAAGRWGPLAGPFCLLTLIWLAGVTGGRWWLRNHDAIRAARERREAEALAALQDRARKAEWHRLAARVGLRGSHLMSAEGISNGETWTIDTYSAGKLASQVDCRHTAERLAGELGKRKSRIEITPDPEWPYRLLITVRERDPWQGGTAAGIIWHPWRSGALDPAAPYADLVPEVPTIRDPVVFGADPETGAPLQVPLWTPNGGQRVLVVATSGAGKSMVMDDICERITACPDARLIQINLSKGVEDALWSRLAEANALAGQPDAAARALRILDFAFDAIPVLAAWRAERRPGARMRVPTPDEPLFVLKIDEVDRAAADPDRQAQLAEIASKCRSEGWALLLGAQRPVNKWIGGAGVRANLSYIVWGKMRAADVRHAGGSEAITLPDIGSYGGNNPGVFGVCAHPTYEGMPFLRGRSFFWGDDSPGLVRLVADRAAAQSPYVLEAALEPLAEEWAAITGTAPAGAPAAPADAPEPAAGVHPGTAPAGAPRRAPDDRYDLLSTPRGVTVPGTAGVRAKLTAALADGTAPASAPDLDPSQLDRLAAVLAADRRRFMADYANLPAADQAALRELLARPEGVSSREAERVLPWGRTKITQQLARWREEGTAELRGSRATARWHAAGPGAEAPYPSLRVISGGGAP